MVGRRLLVVVALCAAAVSAASAPVSALDTRGLNRQLQHEPGLVAVVVEQRGRVVYRWYKRPQARTTRLDVFSVTKSVVSTLVGIAAQHGRLRLDQRLGEFFPNVVKAAHDKQVRTITIRQLLTMTAGYRDTPQARADDWVHTLVDRALAEPPGKSWSYDDGSYHLLSAVLTKVTGVTAQEYARRVLFDPLGIGHIKWANDGQGHSLGNTGVRLDADDLLKLGELYLHDGRWRGRRVVPAAYVRAATRSSVWLGHGWGYGYGWWILGGQPRGFGALGYGGQEIAVFPEKQLVVVVTGAGDNTPRVIYRRVLPALGIR